MLTIREERMNEGMLKLHIGGLPRPLVIHIFTAPDHGDHHDHAQWGFDSTVAHGSYVEEVLHPDGSTEHVHRQRGQSFHVTPDHVHRLVDLPEGVCITVVEPEPHTGRDSAFYQVRDGVLHSRTWREAERGEPFRPHGG